MDNRGDEGRDDERGGAADSGGAGDQPQRARQQSHHSVLGGRGGHHHDYIDHQHYDDAPYVNDLIDIYDHQHILHNNNVNNGTVHHHHGPGNNDILIHDHDGMRGSGSGTVPTGLLNTVRRDDHVHVLAWYDHDFTYVDYEYSPADHNHDADVAEHGV